MLERSHPERKTQAGFPPTHWSVVLAAAGKDSSAAGEALNRLCAAYWYPLYAFVRRQGASPHQAQDLTQEFLCQFLAGSALARVHPEAGRFRSFLLACLRNFLSNQRARENAQRRGGGQAPISINGDDAEAHYLLEPVDHLTPEGVFERRWAFFVLEQTLLRLRQEYEGAGKLELFEVLQGFLPCGQGEISRADLAARRGVSVGAIDVAVHRLRQRFGALLREQVAETTDSPAEIDEEIRHLISVVGA